MWGILIGIGVGLFELFLLKKIISAMTAGKNSASAMFPLAMLKLVIMLAALYGVAALGGVFAMLWCAGGLAGVLVGVPIALGIYSAKHQREEQK